MAGEFQRWFAPPSAVGCFCPGYLCRQQALGQWEEIHGWQPLAKCATQFAAAAGRFGCLGDDPAGFGLPDGFPGLSGLPSLPGSALDAVRHVEGALSTAMGSPARFIPFVALHEFEAWYFANPVKVAEFFGTLSVAEIMEQASREAGGPENIHQGKETHPSKRLERYGMGFRKTSAVALLQEIGIDAIRKACPHFNNWLTRLKKLGMSV